MKGRVVGSVLLFAVLVLPAAAQDASPIPRDLALALLGGGSTALRVGEAGAGPLAALGPASLGRVVGEMERAGNVTWVIEAGSPDGLALLDQRAAAAGWTRPEEPFGRMNGFEGSRARRVWSWCTPEWVVSPSATVVAGRTYLVVRARGVQRSECDPRRGRTPRLAESWFPVPALRAMPNVRVDPVGQGGSDDHWEMTAFVWDATARDVYVHYAGELELEGWTPVGEPTAGPAWVGTWHRSSDDGTSWSGLLVAWRAFPGPLAVRFEVLSEEAARRR